MQARLQALQEKKQLAGYWYIGRRRLFIDIGSTRQKITLRAENAFQNLPSNTPHIALFPGQAIRAIPKTRICAIKQQKE